MSTYVSQFERIFHSSFMFCAFHHSVNSSIVHFLLYKLSQLKRGIDGVQALVDISRSALYALAVYRAISLYTCMLSPGNETRAPIANSPNIAQLEGTPYHSPKLHPGPCDSVGMR